MTRTFLAVKRFVGSSPIASTRNPWQRRSAVSRWSPTGAACQPFVNGGVRGCLPKTGIRDHILEQCRTDIAHPDSKLLAVQGIF